jgi:hypothetical protein
MVFSATNVCYICLRSFRLRSRISRLSFSSGFSVAPATTRGVISILRKSSLVFDIVSFFLRERVYAIDLYV